MTVADVVEVVRYLTRAEDIQSYVKVRSRFRAGPPASRLLSFPSSVARVPEANMSISEEYDLVVLGSGRGRFFAWSLASQGKRAAVVERKYVTGSCPSIACLPSKHLIHGAKVASYFRRGAEFGIAPGDWKVEMPAVRDHRRKMIDGMVALNHQRYRESGAELVMGQGRFVGPKTIEVATADGGTRTLRGDVVVISTGSRRGSTRSRASPRRGR